MKLTEAKQIAVIVASKFLAAFALEDTRTSPGSRQASINFLALVKSALAAEGDNKQLDIFVPMTLDAAVTLANAIEQDVRDIPAPKEPKDPLVTYYISSALTLADLYPGKVDPPWYMNRDDFCSMIVNNRNILLAAGGVEYKNECKDA